MVGPLAHVHAYVISLPGDTERRRHILSSFSTQVPFLSWEISTACHGKSYLADPKSTQDSSSLPWTWRWLSPSTVGCMKSHLGVLQTIVSKQERDDLALVFEDDIVWKPSITRQKIQHLRQYLLHEEKSSLLPVVVHLGADRNEGGSSILSLDDHVIRGRKKKDDKRDDLVTLHHVNLWIGNNGYALTRRSAEHLLHSLPLRKYSWHIDMVWNAMYWSGRLRCYCLSQPWVVCRSQSVQQSHHRSVPFRTSTISTWFVPVWKWNGVHHLLYMSLFQIPVLGIMICPLWIVLGLLGCIGGRYQWKATLVYYVVLISLLHWGAGIDLFSLPWWILLQYLLVFFVPVLRWIFWVFWSMILLLLFLFCINFWN